MSLGLSVQAVFRVIMEFIYLIGFYILAPPDNNFYFHSFGLLVKLLKNEALTFLKAFNDLSLLLHSFVFRLAESGLLKEFRGVPLGNLCQTL